MENNKPEWFNPSNVRANCSWAVIGIRQSGKSHLIAHLMQWWPTFDKTTVFITSEGSRDFGTLVADHSYTDEISPKALQAAVHTEKPPRMICLDGEYYISCNSNGVVHNGTKARCLVIFDNVFQSCKKYPEFEDLILNGRCKNVTTVIETQYALSLPPVIRSNLDYVAFTNLSLDYNKIYEQFFQQVYSREQFEKIYTECVRDYGVLILDRCANKVYQYRAPPVHNNTSQT